MHILKRINPLSVGIVCACVGLALIGLILDVTSADAYDELPTGTVEADALTTCVEATPIVTILVKNGYNFAITASVNGGERIIEAGEKQSFELAFDGPLTDAGSTDVSIAYGGDGFGLSTIRVDYEGIDCSQSTTTTTVAPTTTTIPVAPVELGPGGAVVYNDQPVVASPAEDDFSQEQPKIGLAICG